MGIKNLNKYLLKNCSYESIHKINLRELHNRTIVVDTSIYIYKYLEDGLLLENFQLLIDKFNKYRIKPIFIFDGKPPKEKMLLLKQRKERKILAESEYNDILNKNEEQELSQYTLDRLNKLKKKFIRVTDEDIINLKALMNVNNVQIVDALGESDELCVHYIKSKMAWACLSDDMDMFVYGCNRVLRELSLQNDNVFLYLLSQILFDLKMTAKSFRDILVLSGTDYNLLQENDNICLHETLKWYKWYKVYSTKHRSQYIAKAPDSFYDWLYKNTKYIKDYKELLNVHSMFDISHLMPLFN
jgi:flap endonuclease-1